MLGFIAGLITANASEWYIHKYWLHERGKNKSSKWSYHWHTHHRNVLEENYEDSDYRKNILDEFNGQTHEVASLVVAAAAVAPLFPIAPGFTAAMWLSQYNYYRVHKKSHLDPAWGYKYLPWHYDHHMAPDQDKNWCVTFPLWDYVMGTRLVYKGTEREKIDIDRRLRKAAVKGTSYKMYQKNNLATAELN